MWCSPASGTRRTDWCQENLWRVEQWAAWRAPESLWKVGHLRFSVLTHKLSTYLPILLHSAESVCIWTIYSMFHITWLFEALTCSCHDLSCRHGVKPPLTHSLAHSSQNITESQNFQIQSAKIWQGCVNQTSCKEPWDCEFLLPWSPWRWMEESRRVTTEYKTRLPTQYAQSFPRTSIEEQVRISSQLVHHLKRQFVENYSYYMRYYSNIWNNILHLSI